MKVEEDVKMVASEVPALFSFVAEVFVQELTVRAWMCTEDGKRKILQSSDIGFAVKTSSMYDFLTYVVPTHPYGSVKEEYTGNSQPFLKYPYNDLQFQEKEDHAANGQGNSQTFLDKYPFNESSFPDNSRYQNDDEIQNSYYLENLHMKRGNE